ncbi:hypothetical protein MMC30_002132 [Trapelia coarctata]|nr:hypothetical protein [Trapelia coarctata]
MSSSVNLPQLLAVLLISGVIIRYFFFSSSSASTTSSNAFPGSSSSNGSRRRAVDERLVEQITQMFPQVGRREIIWDLQRNGGSVAATSERILSGSLERPPPSFQPPAPPSAGTSSAPSNPTPAAPLHQDLIQRYNLSSKISKPSTEEVSPGGPSPQAVGVSVAEGKKPGWSANKNERQALLQRRREEMILTARRKLEERDRKEREKEVGT